MPADRLATLAGLALLEAGLAEAGRALAPGDLSYPGAGKPRLRAGPDFSIAHGGGLVACALAAGGRVGLDLEAAGAARAGQLRLVLDDAERAAVAAGRLDPTAAWVMKEAVLKAAGATAAAARLVRLRGRSARFDGREWHLAPVALGPGTVCWLATERPRPVVALRPHATLAG